LTSSVCRFTCNAGRQLQKQMCFVCLALCVRQMSFIFHNFLTFVLISRQLVHPGSLRLAPGWVLQVDCPAWLAPWTLRLANQSVPMMVGSPVGCPVGSPVNSPVGSPVGSHVVSSPGGSAIGSTVRSPVGSSRRLPGRFPSWLTRRFTISPERSLCDASPVGSPVSGLTSWFSTCSHPCCLAY
jgi:hypothetical protein